MPQRNMAISVSSLKKRYQEKEVLRDVNFSVPKGSIYALLGSNGAGKTTTVRILTTQIQADGGPVIIEGCDISGDTDRIHQVISVTGQFSALDEPLTGRENLRIMGELCHLSHPEKRAEELLTYFELSHAADRAVSSYSGGMKRKLDIAMSLVGEPSVIFLDEPTTGLDPQSRLNMWEIIQELKRSGVTIFLTTQYLEEAEQLADTIAILDRGMVIAQGTPKELKAYLPQGEVRFRFADVTTLRRAEALAKGYKISSTPEDCTLSIFTDGKAETLAQLFFCFGQEGLGISQFSQQKPDLEEVFLTMIGEKEEGAPW